MEGDKPTRVSSGAQPSNPPEPDPGTPLSVKCARYSALAKRLGSMHCSYSLDTGGPNGVRVHQPELYEKRRDLISEAKAVLAEIYRAVGAWGEPWSSERTVIIDAIAWYDRHGLHDGAPLLHGDPDEFIHRVSVRSEIEECEAPLTCSPARIASPPSSYPSPPEPDWVRLLLTRPGPISLSDTLTLCRSLAGARVALQAGKVSIEHTLDHLRALYKAVERWNQTPLPLFFKRRERFLNAIQGMKLQSEVGEWSLNGIANYLAPCVDLARTIAERAELDLLDGPVAAPAVGANGLDPLEGWRYPLDRLKKRANWVELLQAMDRLGAVSEEKLRPADEIAREAFGATANFETYKNDLSNLGWANLVRSKLGRAVGGYWFTAPGRDAVSRLKAEMDRDLPKQS